MKKIKKIYTLISKLKKFKCNCLLINNICLRCRRQLICRKL